MKKMILLTSVAILSLGIIAESQAGCEGCHTCCGNNCCGDFCESGYIYDSSSSSCIKKCAPDEVIYGGACVKSSTFCRGGNLCKDSHDRAITNCCYKTEGDTTTVYPYDKTKEFNLYEMYTSPTLDSNKNLIIEAGATKMNGFFGKFENVYISENSDMNGQSCWCCNSFPNTKHIIIPDSGVGSFGSNCYNNLNKKIDIVCLGDVEKCKQYTNGMTNNVVSPTESQCNGSGSYYFTGSSCEHRPTDGTDITCEHEISGYVKVGNYCVSPENSYAKKHYTPAEAAQWLKDGNDNFVILTFKK